MYDLNEKEKSLNYAPWILLHGGNGTGKTTFGCGALDVLLLDMETGKKENTPKGCREPETYNDVLGWINSLTTTEHGFKTLVIDTLDRIEQMITDEICTLHGWDSIMAPGFGKGTSERTREWAMFWKALRELRKAKNMCVILIAHSKIEEVTDPILPSYGTHKVNLYKEDARIACDLVDVVGFARIKVYTTQDGKTRNIANTAGERVLSVNYDPKYDSKTRYARMAQAEEIPLTWLEFAKYFRTPKTTKGDE